ncbi:hypothetical protein KHP11_14335 [Rhodococcus erythropolis]|uniref:hypothetical protein n=1 Tax=Rhodococcus erythropolis TaxID=1833 RepID=UPI001300DCAB|nr:hypothetical protein [Rhodococcus erythropolis]MBT1255635.1 hypothetical protein [Rhodococcus erythropolis]
MAVAAGNAAASRSSSMMGSARIIEALTYQTANLCASPIRRRDKEKNFRNEG